MKMKTWLFAMLTSVVSLHAMADASDSVLGYQNGPALTQFHIDSRFAWQCERQQGNAVPDAQGFRGQYFLLRLDGRMAKGLDFSYRQRLNKYAHEASFFDATDWLYLQYSHRRFFLSAGKMVVAIGGYEYDMAPIDLYYNSEFWYNIPCFQLGASAGYHLTPHDALTFQISNSPFRSWPGNANNALGYSLMWSGRHGLFESLWSVNLFESQSRHYIHFISLGNRFHFGPHVRLDLDFQNRAARHQTFFFRDCSLVACLSVRPIDAFRLTAKYTFDMNRSGTSADRLVHEGTCLHRVSLNLEAEPLTKHREWVRIFAAGGWGWGINTHPDGTISDRQLLLQAGLKFRIDLFECLDKMIHQRGRK